MHLFLPYLLPCTMQLWSLFLQNFDIQWKITPGTKITPADALSQHNLVNTTTDNQNTAICPEPVVINTLDLMLANKIRTSSQSNPLVMRVLLVHGLEHGKKMSRHLSDLKILYIRFKGSSHCHVFGQFLWFLITEFQILKKFSFHFSKYLGIGGEG